MIKLGTNEPQEEYFVMQFLNYDGWYISKYKTYEEAKQKAHELVVTSIRTETAREIFDWLKTKNLLLAEKPEEGKPYQFTGCYITKWGKIDEPTLGMIRFSESNDLLDFKLRYGIAE